MRFKDFIPGLVGVAALTALFLQVAALNALFLQFEQTTVIALCYYAACAAAGALGVVVAHKIWPSHP